MQSLIVFMAICEMMRTRELNMSETIEDTLIEDFPVGTAWAIRSSSTYHAVLKSFYQLFYLLLINVLI